MNDHATTAGSAPSPRPSVPGPTERPTPDPATPEPTGPELSVPELSAQVRTAVARLYSRFRSERAEGEVGDAALSVLIQLLKAGPLSLGELSEHAHVTPGSMSQTVNRLTAGGLAVRGRDPHDGRRVLFSLTDEGARLATQVRAQRIGWLNTRLAALPDPDRAVLARAAEVLQAIADS